MNDAKKKQILIALFVVVFCVGAVQMVAHKRPPAAPDAPKETAKNTEKDLPKGPKYPEYANDLPARDPFLIPADMLPPGPKSALKSLDAPKPFAKHSSRFAGVRPYEPLPLPGSAPSLHGGIGGQTGESELVGVIQGAKPMAFVDDGAGNQKLVQVGGSIDADTRLLSVDGSSALVVTRGKLHRLSIGGKPVGK